MSVPPLDRPKVFRPKMPATWWLRHPKYFLFMMRELSSVFIAIFVVVLLVQIAQLPYGEEAYHAFVQKFRAPGWIIFHIVALLFALYHSLTWFEATSKIIVIRRGEYRVPPRLIIVACIGVWVVLSLVILLLFLFLRS